MCKPPSICRNCSKYAAISSHVVPAWVHRYARKGQPNPTVISKRTKNPTQTGLRYPILCRNCDNKIGAIEKRAQFIFNNIHPLPTSGEIERIELGHRGQTTINRFFSSIALRAAWSNHPQYKFTLSHKMIGRLRRFCFFDNAVRIPTALGYFYSDKKEDLGLDEIIEYPWISQNGNNKFILITILGWAAVIPIQYKGQAFHSANEITESPRFFPIKYEDTAGLKMALERFSSSAASTLC